MQVVINAEEHQLKVEFCFNEHLLLLLILLNNEMMVANRGVIQIDIEIPLFLMIVNWKPTQCSEVTENKGTG